MIESMRLRSTSNYEAGSKIRHAWVRQLVLITEVKVHIASPWARSPPFGARQTVIEIACHARTEIPYVVLRLRCMLMDKDHSSLHVCCIQSSRADIPISKSQKPSIHSDLQKEIDKRQRCTTALRRSES